MANEWSNKLRASHLTQAEAWTALTTTRVMKTLLYATPAMNLTQAQSAHIMAPILMSGLNAVGIQHFLPHSVAYAPICYQGDVISEVE